MKSDVKSEAQRSNEFVIDEKADLPEAMKYAEPTKEEHTKVLAQLDAHNCRQITSKFTTNHKAVHGRRIEWASGDWR